MNIWPYIIALLLIVAYTERRVFIRLYQYRKMKKRYSNTQQEFLTIRVQEIALKMDETINMLDDSRDNLMPLRRILVGQRYDENEDLIELLDSLNLEYKSIKEDFVKFPKEKETLNDIEKRLNDFLIKLNNKLVVAVKQLKSKVDKEYEIK